MISLLALWGCSPDVYVNPNLPAPVATTPTQAPIDTGATVPKVDDTGATLHGVPPKVPIPPPTFAGVANYDGSARTQADLLGVPTILWFYPAAFTGG